MSGLPPMGRMNGLAYELQRGLQREGDRTGTYVLFTPGVRCSCNNENGEPLASCRVCGGEGFYYPASREKKYKAIITQALSQRDYLMGPGIVERDEIVVSFIKRITVKSRDRIRFARRDLAHLNTPAENSLLERGDKPTDALPHRVAELIDVTQSNPRTGAIRTFRPGIDVTFKDNILTWGALLDPPTPGAVMPAIGSEYAVSYGADFDWLVAENEAPRAIADVALGTRALCKRRMTDERNLFRLTALGQQGYDPNLF